MTSNMGVTMIGGGGGGEYTKVVGSPYGNGCTRTVFVFCCINKYKDIDVETYE